MISLAKIAGRLAGWRGYAAAVALGAALAGAAAWSVQGWRYEGRIARIEQGVDKGRADAAERAAKGASNADDVVNRLPDGGAAGRLRDAWARD